MSKQQCNARVAALWPEMPQRIKDLPVSREGYPVPWFVSWFDADGRMTHWKKPGARPDFRVVDASKIPLAVTGRKCWVCGGPLGKYMAFAIGPMCSVNRISAEPPGHLTCMRFAAKACPFLAQPRMVRNEKNLPAEASDPMGIMLKRNPGVTAIWTTTGYTLMGNLLQGVLFDIGDPHALEWWAMGRKATRQEIDHAIETGLPHLRQQCDLENGRERQLAAHRELDRQILKASELLERTAA